MGPGQQICAILINRWRTPLINRWRHAKMLRGAGEGGRALKARGGGRFGRVGIVGIWAFWQSRYRGISKVLHCNRRYSASLHAECRAAQCSAMQCTAYRLHCDCNTFWFTKFHQSEMTWRHFMPFARIEVQPTSLIHKAMPSIETQCNLAAVHKQQPSAI